MGARRVVGHQRIYEDVPAHEERDVPPRRAPHSGVLPQAHAARLRTVVRVSRCSAPMLTGRRDFDAPASPKPPADSSAAMIAVTGLQLLAAAEHSLGNKAGAKKWNAGAHRVRHSARRTSHLLMRHAAHRADGALRVESFMAEPALEWDKRRARAAALDRHGPSVR